MAVNPVAPTSKLEAVNEMLSSIGQYAVKSLDNSPLRDVRTAIDTLDGQVRETLAKGWHFNTKREVQLWKRHNRCLSSDAVGNGTGWSNTNTTILSTVTAPDGTSSARRVHPLGAGAMTVWPSLGSTVLPEGEDVIFSVYAVQLAAAQSLRYLWLRTRDASGFLRYSWFDLWTGTAADGSQHIETFAISDPTWHGFYRFGVRVRMARQPTISSDQFAMGLSPLASASSVPSGAGSAANGAALWGVQIEAASTLMSYIASTAGSGTGAELDEVGVPGSWVDIDPIDNTLDYVPAPDPDDNGAIKLYDRNNNTFTISAAPKVDGIVLRKYEELPQVLRQYIFVRAARVFQQRRVGSTVLYQYTSSDEMDALVALKRSENRRKDNNLLRVGTRANRAYHRNY